jgi:hypothetical protein
LVEYSGTNLPKIINYKFNEIVVADSV